MSGGFLPSPRSIQPITSPAPSHSSISSTIDKLPHPRKHALKAGSAKEDAVRRYVEGRLLGISRRYVKKFQALEDELSGRKDGEVVVKGYVSFREAAEDLSEVVDVLWLSGTPALQVPYLLNVALATQSYLSSFPFSPRASFALLRKLDHAFSSLIREKDVATGEILPGFSMATTPGLSKTDMVRIKGIVEGTRVVIADVENRGEIEEHQQEPESLAAAGTDSDDDDFEGPVGRQCAPQTDFAMEDTDENEPDSPQDQEEGENDMDVARVYEKTITALGATLGSTMPFDAFAGV